jgi:hypothetical protein
MSNEFISTQNFLLDEVPQYHPMSGKYLQFWKQNAQSVVEGHWVSGKWMPGKLYFYGNFGTILLNKKHSKVKFYDRPLVQDLEWEFFPLWEEARGFSGFKDDPKYSCHRLLSREDLTIEEARAESPNLLTPEGEIKTYVSARDYINRIHDHNYGSPLYENEAKNLMMMGPRGFGKSYSVGAGIVAHEFLFDGATSIKEYQSKPSSNTIVGAGDAKYSNDILAKAKVCVDSLPGGIEINGVYYPSPFSRRYKGSWTAGHAVKQAYKIKVGNSWKVGGSGSQVKNITFKDNAYAAQGNRTGIMVFEEIGMFTNLKASYQNSVDNMKDGSYKFGSAMFLGTGGDMEKGTQDAYHMFYNPDVYDLLSFEDTWEMKGRISYFVPTYFGDRKFKDSEGNTMYKEAIKAEQDARKKKAGKSGASAALDSHIVYHPLVPSEVFLVRNTNLFPTGELKRRRQDMNEEALQAHIEKVVELYYDTSPQAFNGVNYSLDVKNKLKPIREFPFNGHEREGALIIYELPILDPETGKVPKDLYIIGHDPFATDNPSGPSLASIYVMKTSLNKHKYGHNEIVAQYVGRPHMGRRVVNELLLKLSLFYGEAKIYFENVRGNVKEYFEKKKKLHLLATQPTTIFTSKASYNLLASASKIYGYPMKSREDKIDAILYAVEWLLEERGEDREGNMIRNLDLIPDPALIDEMLFFNLDGNFDRVMGFLGCIVGLVERFNQYERELFAENELKKSGELDILANNTRLFKSAHPEMTNVPLFVV